MIVEVTVKCRVGVADYVDIEQVGKEIQDAVLKGLTAEDNHQELFKVLSKLVGVSKVEYRQLSDVPCQVCNSHTVEWPERAGCTWYECTLCNHLWREPCL